MASLSGLASIASHQGDVELTDRLAQECLELAQTHNKREWAVVAYSLFGSAAVTAAEARAHYSKALTLKREHDREADISAVLCSLGHVAAPGRDNSQERA